MNKGSVQTTNELTTTRRDFVKHTLKVGTVLAFLPHSITSADAACSSSYGSGLYGRGCYPGILPKLLKLPAVQGNVRQEGFRFFVAGEANKSYKVQFSTDLNTWIDLGNVTIASDGSSFEILDSDAVSSDRRYYRAIPL